MTSGLGQRVGRRIVYMYLNRTTKSVVFCGDFVIESAYPRRACMRSSQEESYQDTFHRPSAFILSCSTDLSYQPIQMA